MYASRLSVKLSLRSEFMPLLITDSEFSKIILSETWLVIDDMRRRNSDSALGLVIRFGKGSAQTAYLHARVLMDSATARPSYQIRSGLMTRIINSQMNAATNPPRVNHAARSR